MLSVSLNNFAEKCAEENCKVSKEKVEHRTEFPPKREGGLDVESLQSVEAGRAKKGKFGLAKKGVSAQQILIKFIFLLN